MGGATRESGVLLLGSTEDDIATLEELSVCLTIVRYHTERSRRRLLRLSGGDGGVYSFDGNRNGDSDHEHADVMASLETRFGLMPHVFYSKGADTTGEPPSVPLLHPASFVPVLNALGACCVRSSAVSPPHGHDTDVDGRAVCRAAAQVIAILPEVGRPDVLSDALLSGQARSCSSSDVAAACGVLLVQTESDSLESEEEGNDAYVDDEDQHRARTTREAQYEDINSRQGSEAYSAALKRALVALTRRTEMGDSVCDQYALATLRTLLSLPAVRDAFVEWHQLTPSSLPMRKNLSPRETAATSSACTEPSSMLGQMFSASRLWSFGTDSLRTAAAWEALLSVLPDPTRGPWSKATLDMLLKHFDLLVRAVTCCDSSAATLTVEPHSIGKEATLISPHQQQRQPQQEEAKQERGARTKRPCLRSNPTAWWYALLTLDALATAAAWFSDNTTDLQPSTSEAGYLFSQRVLASPAIACFCLEAMADAAGCATDEQPDDFSSPGQRKAVFSPDLLLFPARAPATRAGAPVATGTCSRTDLACSILASMARNATAPSARQAVPGAAPSLAAVRHVLRANHAPLLAFLDLLNGKEASTAASASTAEALNAGAPTNGGSGNSSRVTWDNTGVGAALDGGAGGPLAADVTADCVSGGDAAVPSPQNSLRRWLVLLGAPPAKAATSTL